MDLSSLSVLLFHNCSVCLFKNKRAQNEKKIAKCLKETSQRIKYVFFR